MFDECTIRGRRLAPARFCAPLAGYTHSAFRRLTARLGGCGAFWTEMLAVRRILGENFETSPWLRRCPQEGLTVFQLMVSANDSLDRVLDRLGEKGVEAVDLNLACDAPVARCCAAGSALFDNEAALHRITSEARKHWPGILTVKIRLGARRPDWRTTFAGRLRLLEDNGMDAVTLHPRFFEEKFKRLARLELIPWAASLTRLPLIANGDLEPQRVSAHAGDLRPACAVMIGRMAVVRPWIFARWDRPDTDVDPASVWRDMFRCISEDFDPPAACRRIQLFTKYFAANYLFAHAFRISIANAASLEEVRERAEDFFSRSPARVPQPAVAGL